MEKSARLIQREILLSFWKIHILYHAAEGKVVGQWMLQELREHGYEVSPGTLYPLLKRLEGHGWLTSFVKGKGPRARREYKITPSGRSVLRTVKKMLKELTDEV